MNRMTLVTQSTIAGANAVAPKLASFAYDAASQLTDIRRYSATTASTPTLEVHSRMSYDLAGQLKSITHGKTEIASGQNWAGTITVPASLGAGNMLAGYFLNYDQDNRVTSLASWRDASGTNYTYDGTTSGTGTNSTDQLASASSAVIAGMTLPFPLPASETYNLDANGNRKTTAGVSQSTPGTHNRLQTDGIYNYLYDNEGNTIQRTKIVGGQVTEYTLDHRNRLTLVTDKTSSTGSITQRVQYIYDAFNQRTGKRVDLDGNGTWDRHEIFAWADGQEVLRFVDSDGQLVTQPARIANRYLWGPAVDQLLADEQYAIGAGPSVNLTAAAPSVTEGNTLWALADNLGSVRDLVDNNGVVRQHLVFDSFGRRVREVDYNTAGAVIASTDPAAVDELFGYTGRDWDTHTGLQYNRARWYDPNTGRWLSQDPIGFGGGDANLYRFVGNGATNATDPSGLDQLTNEQKQWVLARATKLLASMNLSEEERNIRIAILQAALFHQMGFSSQFPPNPKYWNEEGDRYVLKKSLAREGVHARVFGLGPLFTYTDEDGKKHSINGSSTGCSNAARLLFLEGIAKVAEEQKKLKEFEDEFSGKSMLELFPEDESSGYHRSYGAIPKQPPFAINPNDFLPGDRVRMGNHRLPKGVGFEGSNVIYLGRNEFDQHMFLKMDGGDVFNGYLLRLIVSGYSDDPDPNLRNYVFVERYSPLVPNFLKPSKKFNCD